MASEKKYEKKDLDETHPEDFGYLGSREDTAESRTVESRSRLRTKLQDDVEAFLQSGGSIECVDSSILGDPPRKPVSNYGGRPI